VTKYNVRTINAEGYTTAKHKISIQDDGTLAMYTELHAINFDTQTTGVLVLNIQLW